jgi:hypothetical protein
MILSLTASGSGFDSREVAVASFPPRPTQQVPCTLLPGRYKSVFRAFLHCVFNDAVSTQYHVKY